MGETRTVTSILSIWHQSCGEGLAVVSIGFGMSERSTRDKYVKSDVNYRDSIEGQRQLELPDGSKYASS